MSARNENQYTQQITATSRHLSFSEFLFTKLDSQKPWFVEFCTTDEQIYLSHIELPNRLGYYIRIYPFSPHIIHFLHSCSFPSLYLILFYVVIHHSCCLGTRSSNGKPRRNRSHPLLPFKYYGKKKGKVHLTGI